MARFKILGPLSVSVHDRPVTVTAGRDRTALALLLLHPGQILSTNTLIEALWETPPATARAQVHTCVARLRRLLGADTILSDPAGYSIRLDADDLDATVFDHLLVRARAEQDPTRFREALALWRGDALAGIDSPLVRHAASAVDERRAVAVEDWIDAELRAGNERAVIGELTGLVERFPLRERLREQLMTALYRAGRQADALLEYRRARQVFVDELGIEPGPALRAAHERILAGEPETTVEVPERDPAPYPALPKDISSFVGRTDELKRLDGLADTVAVLSGTAGVGKTSLAVYWAHRAGDRFPDGQLYVNLRGFDPDPASAPATTVVLRGFLESLGVPADRIPADPEPRAALLRRMLSTRRVLMILDNARDAEQVRPLLVGSAGCLSLVTSRSQLAGLVAIEDAVPVPLDVLHENEAIGLLSARLGAERVLSEPDAVAAIVRRCALLPLALAVIAARAAARPGLPLAALATELADASLDPFTTDDEASDARAIFSWSYRALSAPAARLFRLLSVHPGRHLGLHAAASLAGLPLRQTRAVLGELLRVHLADEQLPGRYSMHDLLRAYATELAADDPDRHAAAHRLVDHYTVAANTASGARRLFDSPPTDPPGNGVIEAPTSAGLDWFTVEDEALVPIVELAVAEGLDRRVWQLAAGLVSYLQWSGNGRGAVAVTELALAAALRQGDADATVFSYRAVVSASERLYTLEERLAISDRMTSFCAGLDDPVAVGWAHLVAGTVLFTGGRFEDGLVRIRLVLELPPDEGRPGARPFALNALSWALIQQGDPAAALPLLTELLTVAREHAIYGIQVVAESEIGLALHNLGRSAEAIPHFAQAEADAPGYLTLAFQTKLHHWYGDACSAIGDLARARLQWRIALEMLETLEDPAAEAIRAKLTG